MERHALRRTSPIGGLFIGVCTKCGREGLTIEDMQTDECPNVRGVTDAQALAEALDNRKAH